MSLRRTGCGGGREAGGVGAGRQELARSPRSKARGLPASKQTVQGNPAFELLKQAKHTEPHQKRLRIICFLLYQEKRKKKEQGERQRHARNEKRNEKTTTQNHGRPHARRLPAPQGLSAAFRIQAAAGKWQGCDVNRAGKFFQRMLLRGAGAGVTRSGRELL